MSIKNTILGLLVEGPRHGYGLKSAYEEQLAPGDTVNIGQVYQALNALESAGHVTLEVVEQAERPDRKVYTVTEAGLAELARWLAGPAKQKPDLRNEMFLKVMLALHLSRSPGAKGRVAVNPLKVVDGERRSVVAVLHELTSHRAKAEKEGARQTVLMLDFAILQLNALHQWLDRCEEMIRGEK